MDAHWPAVAGYFRAVAAGKEELTAPLDMPKKILADLTRVGRSASLAGVQLPRTLEIISVGIGDPFTGVNLFAVVNDLKALRQAGVREIPSELSDAVQRFAGAAKERARVAERLRGFVTGEVSESDESDLPVALRLFLTQFDAAMKGRPIPIDPDLVGFAAIRCRHGSGPMGDCILFSVRVMLGGQEEARMLANYFLAVAQGGPPAPAPTLHEPHMRWAAEEIRSLADRAVGGMRMLMSPADGEATAHGPAQAGE